MWKNIKWGFSEEQYEIFYTYIVYKSNFTKRNANCENILNETSVKNNMRYFTPMLIFFVWGWTGTYIITRKKNYGKYPFSFPELSEFYWWYKNFRHSMTISICSFTWGNDVFLINTSKMNNQKQKIKNIITLWEN